ncbi:MAG TPA: hypothetical protein VFB43_16405 [Terracidiphilus sp.]|nr:hypothetical protein [Terracidiphilus sp.]
MLKRACQLMVVTCLLGEVAWAASDRMVGDWKLNPQKSKLTDVMKVESLGGNKYSFDFGGGEPEIATADGRDQPGHFGTMIVVRVNAPDKWTFVRKKDGKPVVTGVWTLSKDGNTLNDHFTGTRPNGDMTSLDYVYRRTGRGSGFVGTWVSSSEQVNSVVVLKVRDWDGDGLSFISQGGAGTRNVKFDGKDYPNVGAMVNGVTASAERVNERTINIREKITGKVRDTQEISVSPDGKILTVTIHIPGRSEPDVQVFDRLTQ